MFKITQFVTLNYIAVCKWKVVLKQFLHNGERALCGAISALGPDINYNQYKIPLSYNREQL